MSASRRAGLRYRELAARCRQSAVQADDVVSRTGLLQMAAAYDRKAVEIECAQILLRPRNRPAILGPDLSFSDNGRHSQLGAFSPRSERSGKDEGDDNAHQDGGQHWRHADVKRVRTK
jgi:hypothetical protein